MTQNTTPNSEPSPQERPRLTVAAVIEQDRRFLMIEELDNGVPVINQPAGHMEFGETPEQAAVRETLEETGWHFKPTHLQGIYQSIDPVRQRQYLRMTFTGPVTRHDPHRQLDHGILRTIWLTYEEILLEKERLRSPMVLRCIEDYLRDESYPLGMIHSDLPEYHPPVTS
ncbi:MAG: NUDIX hydrolase [Gammaproteobacteria bacterium]|nr:NUDIX hydrolase [Gammaproteobacteria bacterium]MBT3472239.1 NUDIX hydrolase [Gammaproteobacteria bacterium]MBT3966823.1 NUDIX hydrolase [Gammaproteobacteria bacterium]MBT6079057.1 NUDIX hydrolase [Gammaproteobacteria bacterium]MBT7022403.1 NUDIX hydrolase [Gammaproteobacteria bacterium]